MMKRTNLDDDNSLIVTDRDLVPVLLVGNTPSPLQSVAESVLEPVRRRVPDLDSTVLGSRDDDGKGRMEDGEGDVPGVRFEGLNAGLGVVVPDLDSSVE